MVCGGLFLCGAEVGTKILKRLLEIFVETTEMGYGHGEEMLYLEVLDEFYDDFHFGYGDYGQMFNNMLAPTKNIDYIFNVILKGFFNACYHREAYDCSKALIDQFSSHQIDMNYKMYLETLFMHYVSSYYCKREASRDIVDNILDLCERNPLMKKEFKKVEDFYMSQFGFVL